MNWAEPRVILGHVSFRKACSLLALPALALGVTAPADAAVTPYGYEVGGTAVTPGTSGGGPTLAPGLYRLDLPNDGSARTVTVRRSAFPNLLANVRTAESDGTSLETTGDHKLEVELVGADGSSCETESDSLSKTQPIDALTATIGWDAGEDSRFSSWGDCQTAASLTVKISHTAPNASGTTAAELLLTGEPKATGDTGRPAGAADTAVLKPAKGATQPEISGGRGFTRATTVTDGTYPTSLTVGGWTFYRVRVGWGQRVAAELRVPADGSNFAPPAGVSVDLALFSPQRADITPGYSSDTSTSATINSNDASQDTLNVFSAPVRWANRTPANGLSGPIDGSALEFTSVAGWYYLGVRTRLTDPNPEKPVASVPAIPADLAVQVTGTPTAGPTYTGSPQPATGQMSVGKGVDQSSVPWVRLSLSVMAVLLAAAAVVWALRQRRGE